jgi:hypothetical protein
MTGKRMAATAALVTALVLGGAACSSHVQPSLGEWAITTHHGLLSNQEVEHVTPPGHKAVLGNGTTSWYFPANAQAYVTGPDGNRTVGLPELTASDGKGSPGIPDYVYSYVGYEINPAIATPDKQGKYTLASHFLQFCIRDACAIQHSINSTENAAKPYSSDPGWYHMVSAIFPRAIDNATQKAIGGFGPDLWTNHGDWQELAAAISADLPAEIQALDGSKAEGQPDYFCGYGSTATDCKPFLVQVSKVVPQDPGVMTAYQLQQTANYQLQAAAARVALAKQLYGADWQFFLGVKDAIAQCGQDHVTCTIYLGNPPIHP